LARLHVSLSDAVVTIPEFWVFLHFQLEDFDGGMGLPGEQKVVGGADERVLVAV
jgi:hypothetical protein